MVLAGSAQWPDEVLGRFRLVPVPPLDEASATALVASWLESVASGDAAFAAAVATLAAGVPGILAPIVERLAQTPIRDPDDVARTLDELAVEPGDPTGIAALDAQFRSAMTVTGYGTFGRVGGATAVLVDLLSASCVRRPDLVARAVSGSRDRASRLEVLGALRRLELAGWVVEVDGVVRLLHPWLADVWRSLPSSAPPATDDIQF
jgi:hypothetical protein